MESLTYTLLADGSSDRALIPIITWLLRQCLGKCVVNHSFAEPWRTPKPPKTLSEKILKIREYYPCDVLFVHRDAENQDPQNRYDEIKSAFEEAKKNLKSVETVPVCVVPVRMTEAWLLFDVDAIREAADNPKGKEPIDLPDLKKVESIPHPEEILHDALRSASGLKGKRLKKFNPDGKVHRISGYINDFSPLRRLSAFNRLEENIRKMIESLPSNPPARSAVP